jgi:hypothetical protein
LLETDEFDSDKDYDAAKVDEEEGEESLVV